MLLQKHRFSRQLKLTVNARGQVKVTMPFFASYRVAQEFVATQEVWIRETLAKVQVVPVRAPLSRSEKEKIRQEAFERIAPLAEYYAKHYGVNFAHISIKDQTTVWGSCSRSGTLSFSWRLIKAPEDVLRYVVIHEVCHLREMNHSKRYWDLVAQTMPDYKVHRRWLKTEGKQLHFSDEL